MRDLLQCTVLATGSHEGHAAGHPLPQLLLAVLFAAYGTGVFYLGRNGRCWPYWRTLSFTTGAVLAAAALSPQLSDHAHHDFRGHMLQHLLLGMVAPLFLVLGAPVSLLLRLLPKVGAARLGRVLNSRFLHVVGHPVTALLLNLGPLFLLYLTPLYSRMHAQPGLHLLQHLHFLLAGYLFTWSIAGPDPAPGRPRLPLRLGVLFVSMAGHAFLSKFLYAYGYPRFTIHPLSEIRAGAQWMYYGGDAAELLLLILLFLTWYRKRGRPHYRLSLVDGNGH